MATALVGPRCHRAAIPVGCGHNPTTRGVVGLTPGRRWRVSLSVVHSALARGPVGWRVRGYVLCCRGQSAKRMVWSGAVVAQTDPAARRGVGDEFRSLRGDIWGTVRTGAEG